MHHSEAAVRCWDARASRYLELFRDEFESKPYDLAVLDRFAPALPAAVAVWDDGVGHAAIAQDVA